MWRRSAAIALCLAGCDTNAITGTWRSDAVPPVVLELDEDGAGTLTIGEFVYAATMRDVGTYRYELDQCNVFPELDPTCTVHDCAFEEDDDDLFDTWDEGPNLNILVCEIEGRGRLLYAD
jgi:hypothetical protein